MTLDNQPLRPFILSLEEKQLCVFRVIIRISYNKQIEKENRHPYQWQIKCRAKGKHNIFLPHTLYMLLNFFISILLLIRLFFFLRRRRRFSLLFLLACIYNNNKKIINNNKKKKICCCCFCCCCCCCFIFICIVFLYILDILL